MARSPNPRLAKIHRSYAVEEVASLYRVHRNTVREWLKQGLKSIDDRRPLLVLGSELQRFLIARRSKNKRPCRPGEIYCVRCRLPHKPAGDMVDFKQLTAIVLNAVALCPVCGSLMFRRVRVDRVHAVFPSAASAAPQGGRHIGESLPGSVNSDFGGQGAP